MRKRETQLRRALRFLATLLGLAAATRNIPAQPAPDPELERASFQVADGFEVSLYAADPMLAKPIQMNFDPAGRLWVATSEIYPQIKPGQAADDKVLVLEDTTGAGRADKVTVFARGLLIPTGVLPGDGGCYVANSTELLHFRDTDGDGKADERRVVLSGFGTEDTHHIIHTFRWGQDGILYFNQSVYIHSHVETPYGPRRLAAGGTWAFRPETQELGVFSRGLINHWGHAWDKYGDSFMTDGAGDGGIHYAFPGVCFWSLNDQAPRILHPTEHGLNRGSPKFAGAEVISGRHFPDDWQGDIITNDFRANRVVRFKLSEDGAGFSSKLMPDVIRTKDKAFRPVDVKMGPDGALYIADWYNPIINHGEVDFRDPRRDKTHGRIWKLTAKGRPLVARPKLAGAPVEQLLEALKAPEDYTRRQARLAMREMDKAKVTAALDQWVPTLSESDDFTRLQALWTYQTIDHPNFPLATALAKSTDPGIRAAAARVLGAWSNRAPSPSPKAASGEDSRLSPSAVGEGGGEGRTAEQAFATLATLAADSHPRVRLEAVRALAEIKTPESMQAALGVLDHPMDQFLDFALYLTVNDLQSAWLPAFQSGQFTFGRNSKKLEFALKAIRNPAAVKPLVAEFKSGKVSPESRKDVIDLIASLGTADDLTVLFDDAVANSTDNSTRVAILQALDRAARLRNARPKSELSNLQSLMTGRDDAVTAAALRLAGALKAASLRGEMVEWTKSYDRGTLIRAGIDALADLGDSESVKTLVDIAGPKHNTTQRLWASAALAQIDANRAAPLLTAALASDTEYEIDLGPILGAFLKRKNGPAALGAALKANPLPQDAAKLALRAAYALGHSEPVLVDPLKAAARIDSQPKQLSPDEMKQLVADVQSKGDAARGEQIFRRADTACFRCHSIAGAGGQLAPDLISAGSAPVDYLVDSILQPSKAVKEGYHALIVETKDGDQFTGIKVRQTDRELILRDAVQEEIVIPLDQIKGRPREGGSMMPAGLADPLTRQELLDLVRFLSELGRPGPYAISNTPTARRWEVRQTADAVDTATHPPRTRLNSRSSDIWLPDYAKVSGALPVRPGLARCQVNVTTGGPVKFVLAVPKGAAAWIDDAPAASSLGTELSTTLAPGVHTLTLSIPPDATPDATLRAELADVPGSPAKAQFVTGR
jgi:putative heme-binding domain-containing protein